MINNITMSTMNKKARMVGAFFLISNVTFLIGAVVFVEAILGDPDYLSLASQNRSQMIFGVLLEITNGLAYLGIALLMFPLFKQRFESLAIGYVGLRFVEWVMQILSGLSVLALLVLSEEFLLAGAPQASAFQTIGAILLAERYWAFQMVSITLGLGALIFYYMLYQLKLIPRFISVWGLIGALTVLTTTMLDIFALEVGTELGLILGLPMLLNELFLGVWLIIKGFNKSGLVSDMEA